MKKDKILVPFCYAMVYLVWGSTYLAMTLAVRTIPASLVVALRFSVGALILFAIALARGSLRSRPSLTQVGGSVLLGILLLLAGNGLMTEAQKTIPSYVMSLIVACMPFIVACFNFILYRMTISVVRFIGVLIGLAGIALLLWDGKSLLSSVGPGVLIALAGSLAWGFGTSVAQRLPKAPDVFLSTAIQMTAASAAALGLALFGGVDIPAAILSAASVSLGGVAYLAVLGSLTLVAYNYLLVKEPSFRVSSYSLVNPLISVALGLAAGEAAKPWLGAAVPTILAGLALMLYGDLLRERISARFSDKSR